MPTRTESMHQSMGLGHLRCAIWSAVKRMLREHFTGTAAELAYYGLLSAIPCFAVLVGILGLLGSHPETTEAVKEIVSKVGSTDAAGVASGAARAVVERNGAAGLALGTGLLSTLWVASIYLGAFRRAAFRVRGADPGSGWRARPLEVAFTFVSLLLLAIVALALTVTKRIIGVIGEEIGAEDAAIAVWSTGRWVLTLAVLVLMIAALYNLAPPEGRARVRLFSPGSVAAVLVWLFGSAAFEIWVGSFASYDATYGTLAGTIAFAVWLWISNFALLFGLTLDIELQRAAEKEDPRTF